MDGLKQRIIGALVLISLAVIFVPMVFDEPHSERTSTNIRIPEEPPFPEVNTPDSNTSRPSAHQGANTTVDSSVDGSVDSPSGKSANAAPAYRLVEEPDTIVETPSDSAQASSQTANISTVKPVNKTEPLDTKASGSESDSTEYAASLKGAWLVQLGSFGNTDNARRLRNDVREKGYGSSLQEVVRGDAKLTRVFSGPFASKSDAEAAKQALDKAFNLNSLVTTGDK